MKLIKTLTGENETQYMLSPLLSLEKKDIPEGCTIQEYVSTEDFLEKFVEAFDKASPIKRSRIFKIKKSIKPIQTIVTQEDHSSTTYKLVD